MGKVIFTIFFCLANLFAQSAFCTPTLSADKAQVFSDQSFKIRASGLSNNAQAIIRARTQDTGRSDWTSWALFQSNGAGVIDISSFQALDGTYKGVDPVGLIWSMSKVGSTDPSGDYFVTPFDQSFEFSLEVKGVKVSSIVVHRKLYDDKKIDKTVLSGGAAPIQQYSSPIGKLFEPKDGGKHPAVLVLGGSEGGIADRAAALLASQGYVTLALAYFNSTYFKNPNIKSELTEIPLEYFKNSVEWLKLRPSVDPQRIAVQGTSKGGELALLLAANFPNEFAAVIGIAPSSVVWEGLPQSQTAPSVSSWTLNGIGIPYIKPIFLPSDWTPPPIGSVSFRKFYDRAMADAVEVKNKRIPVEKIKGRILLFAGEDDQMWPSTQFTQMIVSGASGMLGRVQWYSYPSAGHLISEPGAPLPMLHAGPMALGGTPEGNVRASADVWARTIKFLKDVFSPSKSKPVKKR